MLDPINQMLSIGLKSYLVGNCLTKLDRMPMAVSLEGRVPFLDNELVELVFRIPGRFKLNRGTTKPLLKCIAAQRIPHEYVFRQKQGLSVPIKQWLCDELRPTMHAHLTGRANNSHLLWTLMVFQRWHDLWLSTPAATPTREPLQIPA